MLKKVFEWTDKQYEEALKDENTRRRNAKAFGLGCIEGAINFSAVFGAVVYTALIATALKHK